MPFSPIRKATNLTLDSDLLSDAKALNVNLSRAAEEGVRAAVIRAREDQWRAENATALERVLPSCLAFRRRLNAMNEHSIQHAAPEGLSLPS